MQYWKKLKYITLIGVVFFVLLCCGVGMGLNALTPMLISEDVFFFYCKDQAVNSSTSQTCEQQLKHYSAAYMITVQSATTLAFPVGYVHDLLGRRKLAILASVLWTVSTIVFAFSVKLSNTWGFVLLTLGSVGMIISGISIYFATLTFSSWFKYVSSLLNAAWDLSAMVYFLFNEIYSLDSGISFTDIFVVYGMVVGVGLMLFAFFCFPPIEVETNIEEIAMADKSVENENKLVFDDVMEDSAKGHVSFASASINDDQLENKIRKNENYKIQRPESEWKWSRDLFRRDFISLVLVVSCNEPFLLWYMTTLSEQTEWIYGGDYLTDKMNFQIETFSFLLFALVPLCFIFGWLLNSINARVRSWVPGFLFLAIAGASWGTLSIIRVPQLQYVTYCIFIIWRMVLWTLFAQYLAENPAYPMAIFGRVFGLVVSISGIATWFNLIWNFIVHDEYGIVNGIYMILGTLSLVNLIIALPPYATATTNM